MCVHQRDHGVAILICLNFCKNGVGEKDHYSPLTFSLCFLGPLSLSFNSAWTTMPQSHLVLLDLPGEFKRNTSLLSTPLTHQATSCLGALACAAPLSGTLSVFRLYLTYISPLQLHPSSASSLLSSFRSLLSCPFFRGSFPTRMPLLQSKWHLLSVSIISCCPFPSHLLSHFQLYIPSCLCISYPAFLLFL